MTPRRWIALIRRASTARRTVLGALAILIGIGWLTAGSNFDIVIGAGWILLGVTQLRRSRKDSRNSDVGPKARSLDPPAANGWQAVLRYFGLPHRTREP